MPIGACIADDGALSVCAYSDCWEGKVTAIQYVEPFSIYFGIDVPWSYDSIPKEDILVVLNQKAGFASLMVCGFVTPLMCGR